MKDISLELGQKLYHPVDCRGLLIYRVTGIVIKENISERIYEVECENCKDHSPCKLYIIQNDDKTFRFYDMINNNEHDYLHEGEPYFQSKKEADEYRLRKILDKANERLLELKQAVKNEEKFIAELKKKLKQLEETK